MIVQRLSTEGAGRLRALRLRALRDAPDAFASTYDEVAARPPESWPRQVEELATFVAVADGADVGLARGGADEARPGTALLLSMWVAPEARGAGAGDALVTAVVDWARSAGLARVALEVGDDNRHAVALYARHGFVPTGRTSTLPPPRDHVTEHERAREL